MSNQPDVVANSGCLTGSFLQQIQSNQNIIELSFSSRRFVTKCFHNSSMRIAVITDAWQPQVNGVTTTYEYISRELESMGHQLLFITSDGFFSIPCPAYPAIRLAVYPIKNIINKIESFEPEAIHIVTEGTLGHAARNFCVKRMVPFTTSFHSQLPEYIRMRTPIPIHWTYKYLRWFHKKATQTFVPTCNLKLKLAQYGFKNILVWSSGVDTDLFRPRDKSFLNLPRPLFMYMGMVAVEKNIEEFLRLDLPGSKAVVGDGPDMEMLKYKYPRILFTGYKYGDELVSHLAAADVFVFPCQRETFSSVLLEAMACGVPVAAFPVTGPIDIVKNGVTGILNDNLYRSAMDALTLNPQDCIDYARTHTWKRSAEEFLGHLAPFERLQ